MTSETFHFMLLSDKRNIMKHWVECDASVAEMYICVCLLEANIPKCSKCSLGEKEGGRGRN